MTAEKGGFQRKPVVPCPQRFATSNHRSSLSTPQGSAYWIKHFSLKHICGCLSLHLFGGKGLAVDVKHFCQNNPQTNNAPRRGSVDYKNTSMKTNLVASGLRTANPLHLIRQIPWTVSVPVPHGELLLQRPVAPPLQRRSPQSSSHVEQIVCARTHRLPVPGSAPGRRLRVDKQGGSSMLWSLCVFHIIGSRFTCLVHPVAEWGASGSRLSVSIKAACHQDCRQTAQKREH